MDIEYVKWALSTNIASTQKEILLQTARHHDQELSVEAWCKMLSTHTQLFESQIQKLQEGGYLVIHDGHITASYNGFAYTVVTHNPIRTAEVVRKAKTLTDKARNTLELMRLSSFVGDDLKIFDLALLYDQIALKHTGKERRSIPPAPRVAKKSANWGYFKKLHNMLVLNGFHPRVYLESQFLALKKAKGMGTVTPYPSMLYSSWAIKNYVDNVKQSLETEMSDTVIKSEGDLVREVLQSSMTIVHQMRDYNQELTELQCLLISQDSLSPIYLAIHSGFLSKLSKTMQDIPEDVGRVLVRFDRDTQYKKMVIKTYKELLDVRRGV